MPVPTPVNSPMTVSRGVLKGLLATEFAADGFMILDDILHKSLGRDGKTRIATSPLAETPVSSGQLVMQYGILVQFYGPWEDEIDNELKVDPSVIETYAERFKRALRLTDPNTNNAWFFNLTDIQYPHDPTGNATRFEARVIAFGNNSSLMETTG